MSVKPPRAGVPVPDRTVSDTPGSGKDAPSASGESTTVEKFYQRYRSLKETKAPAIDKSEIKSVFDFFDENRDGLISKDDLRMFMGKLGFVTTEEDICSMVNSVDVNGDGNVDFDEFASLYETFASADTRNGGEEDEDEDDLKGAFHVFDKNSDGLISPTELQEVLVNLGITEGQDLTNCQRMIQNVDADGNGAVDFGEFKKMMSGDFARG